MTSIFARCYPFNPHLGPYAMDQFRKERVSSWLRKVCTAVPSEGSMVDLYSTLLRLRVGCRSIMIIYMMASVVLTEQYDRMHVTVANV